MSLPNITFSLNILGMEESASAHRSKKKARVALRFSLSLAVLSIFTCNIVTFAGSLVCLAILCKDYTFWKTRNKLLRLFYTFSLAAAIFESAVLLLIYICELTGKDSQALGQLTAIPTYALFVVFVLALADIAFVVLVYRAMLRIYIEFTSPLNEEFLILEIKPGNMESSATRFMNELATISTAGSGRKTG